MDQAERPIAFGDFTLDPADRRLSGKAGPIHIGGRAFDVLSKLLEAEGRLVSKERLFAEVWNGLAVSDAALTSVVRELRIALDDRGPGGMIQAVYGKGYRLEAQRLASLTQPSDSFPGETAPALPKLAVLPFDDLSPRGDMSYFSDGVSEEILSILTRGSEIRTVSKLSSFAFRGAEKASALRKLDASHFLDGSVRKTGDRVRITAYLIESATGDTVWSESFEDPQRDLMEAQVRIARAIASQLEQQFAHADRGEIDPLVYDLYLMAKDVSSTSSRQIMQVAALEHVVREEPDFAAGWGALASALAVHRLSAPIPRWSDILCRARKAIDRALTLDPGEPSALIAEFQLMAPFGMFDDQRRALERMRPEVGNTAIFHHMAAWHFANLGCFQKAIDANLVAEDLEPNQAQLQGFRGSCLYYAGRLEEAREELLACVKKNPEDRLTVVTLMNCAAVMKDAELLEELTDRGRLKQYPLGDLEAQIEISRYFLEDDREGLRAFASDLERSIGDTGRCDLLNAVYLAEGTSPEHCHDILADVPFGSSSEHPSATDFIALAPMLLFLQDFPAIRMDARFARLCARLGLAQFWTSTDTWPDSADDGNLPYDFRQAMKAAAAETKAESVAF